MKRNIYIVFWLLLIFFALLLSGMFGVEFYGLFREVFLIAVSGILSLGVALIYLVKKSKLKNPKRRYFLLTGAGSLGMIVSIILHNLTDAFLSLVFKSEAVIEEPVFFVLGVIVFPVLFLVGSVGVLFVSFRGKK